MLKDPLILIAILTMLLPIAAWSEAPAALVLEAEDFHPESGSAWQVARFGETYFHCAIGAAYFSQGRLLSAPEQCSPSSAHLTAQVPGTARYKVWVHFESPKDYNVSFGLAVEQNGRKVLDVPMGGAEQIKVWPLYFGTHAQIDPYYGGGDNVAWQSADVELSAGEATFTLYTRDNPEPAAKRNIDVIYLTTELSDEPKNPLDPFLQDLSMPGRLWLRVTNTGSMPMQPTVLIRYNRRPWWAPDTARQLSGLPSMNAEIPPGGDTGWMDLGTIIDKIHGTSMAFRPGRDDFTGALLEFAHTPDAPERWDYNWEPDEIPLHVLVPSDLDLNSFMSGDQICSQVMSHLQGLPEGPLPKKIKFVTGMMGPGLPYTGKLTRWADLFYKLGYTGPCIGFDWGGSEEDWLTLLGGDATRRALGHTHTDPTIDPQKLREMLSGPKHELARRYVEVFSIGDEIQLSEYAGPKDEEFLRSFRDRMKASGFTLRDLGISDWSEAEPVKDEQALEHPILYVEGIKHRNEVGIRNQAGLTRAVKDALGADVGVGANYAPHPAFLLDEWQWIDVFKYRGLTMPWSEDYHWQVPVASSQIIGFQLDTMRSGAKYYDAPMIYYSMPHSPGTTDATFRLSNYLALGRGVKYIDHFLLGPELFSTENHVQWRDASRYREIYSIIREAGRVDDLLHAGKSPKTDVALMLSRYTDIWEKFGPKDEAGQREHNWVYNAYGVERQGIWLALRHAQVPVDMLTDPDVSEGWLSKYKVLYLGGTHISRQAAEQIRDWVEAGGILFSSAGGGLYDEYDRPLDVLLPVYGISSQSLRQQDWLVRAKMELPRLSPIDTARVSTGRKAFSMESLALKSSVEGLQGAEVLGTFSDGSAAVVRNRFGKGTAYLVNTMPGLAYQKSAIPVRPFDRNKFAHFLPTDFSREVRELVSLPLKQAKVTRPVECSEPLVDAGLLSSHLGTVVSLANFADRPLRNLVVTVSGIGSVSRAWSVRQGELPFHVTRDGVHVRMRLDVADFLVIEP